MYLVPGRVSGQAVCGRFLRAGCNVFGYGLLDPQQSAECQCDFAARQSGLLDAAGLWGGHGRPDDALFRTGPD